MPRTTDSAKQQAVERVWLTVRRRPNGITEGEIAGFSGIQRRTVNNYLNELCDEGKIDKEGTLWFPLNYEETRLRAFNLSPEEAYTLYLASRLLVKQQDKRNEPAESALHKLAEVLTADAGVGQEIAQAASELANRPTRPGYQSIFTAMVRGYIYRKRVAIRYRPLNGRSFETTFETYLMEPSAIGYATYAIGRSSLPDALRAYKIERIEDAQLTRQGYRIPTDFPGLDILRNSWSIIMGDETVDVELRFCPRVRERVLETQWHPSQVIEDDPEMPGHLLWRVRVADTTDMLPWIRGWGADVEALAPERLRHELIHTADQLHRIYAADPNIDSTDDVTPQISFASNPVDDEFIAHTKNLDGKRQGLNEHLDNVASMAREFAASFGAANAAHLLGRWHDLGKYHPDFQDYLRRAEREPKQKHSTVDHKSAGASLAWDCHTELLAMIIQGHHGGLRSPTDLKRWLDKNKQHAKGGLAEAEKHLPDLREVPPDMLPAYIQSNTVEAMVAAEFYLRMLFSALVDADFLDTEAHFNPDRSSKRHSAIQIDDLWDCFRKNQTALLTTVADTPVNALRKSIYDSCIEAAAQEPGLYRMTVPTGGGKTRTGLAFALRHAQHHNMQRIIVAVPYISITEQTVQVYRDIFANLSPDGAAVLEHHSGSSERITEPSDYDPATIRSRLAAENWDAPIIVTTTVQLFESLFANATSRCRKLHRLANSVIILDEVQTLPVHLLDPILDAIRELTDHYNASIVLSTATQPAFEILPIFKKVIATEIAPDPVQTFQSLKRVEYEWHVDAPMSWPEVAELTQSAPQAMAVVNTKKDAMVLLDAVNDPHALHLSTLLCGAHRRAVLTEVKRRLAADEPCTLVSTQVVEAGVDLDFPIVLRALGPLTSIIQAAGRANREGKLERGRVIIFEPEEGGVPIGPYKRATQTTRSMLHGGPPDMDDPDTTGRYLELLYKIEETDKKNVQQSRKNLDYVDTAQRFRMIEEDTVDVVVLYGSDEEQEAIQSLLADLRAGRVNTRMAMRRLQPYLVSIYQAQTMAYQQRGFMTEVETIPGLYEWHGKYDPVRGLVVEAQEPDKYVL